MIDEQFRFQSRNGLIWTVWDNQWELIRSWFQSRNGLIWTRYRQRHKGAWIMRFQSRNGLIWTQTLIDDVCVVLGFQSRNGLIWTLRIKITPGNEFGCFNPATVWFEHEGILASCMDEHCFNPATVWFERSGSRSRQATSLYVSIPQRSDLNRLAIRRAKRRTGVSIPQRSDLNAWSCERGQAAGYVSIPQRSDLNYLNTSPRLLWILVSIPQRSDLNGSLIASLTWSIRFQSRNGLIWT